jgi:CRISPR-associated endonuclease/helicase Cas3
MGRVMRRVDLMTGKVKGTDKEFKYEDFYKDKEANVLVYYQKEKNKIKESGKGGVYEAELIQKAYEVLKNVEKIEENGKQDLVVEFYKNLENSKYLQKFYSTLRILNSGYVSENMEEAHELFRKIYTIPVIEEDKIGELVEKINKEKNISWLWFKKNIIAEYVINENMWKYKEYELGNLWRRIEGQIEDEGIKEKLKKYCSGIYVLQKGSGFL